MIATSLRIVPWRCESLWHFLSIAKPVNNVKYVNFTNIDTSQITDMNAMFEQCNTLENLKWGSYKENANDELMHQRCKIKVKNSK